MSTKPPHFREPAEACTSRKWQAPLNDNGEPVVTVTVSKRRKIAAAPTKSAPSKKGASIKKKASVEEVPEESIRSESPQNPRNILEASDGSDDNFDVSSAPMDVDGDEDEIIEKPEEDDEAELGLYLLATFI